MKTVLFNETTNFVIGFGEAVIDPEATKTAIKTKIENSTEVKNINKNNIQIASYAKQNEVEKHNAENVFYLSGKRNNKNERDVKLLLKVAYSEAKAMLNADEHKKLSECENKIVLLKENALVVMEKNKIESGKLENKRASLTRTDAIYCGCGKGEVIINNDVFNDLVEKMDSKAEGNNYKVILTGGKTIGEKLVDQEYGSVELVVAPEPEVVQEGEG